MNVLAARYKFNENYIWLLPFPKSQSKNHPEKKKTPQKINMEHNHGGLEDHFPF